MSKWRHNLDEDTEKIAQIKQAAQVSNESKQKKAVENSRLAEISIIGKEENIDFIRAVDTPHG